MKTGTCQNTRTCGGCNCGIAGRAVATQLRVRRWGHGCGSECSDNLAVSFAPKRTSAACRGLGGGQLLGRAVCVRRYTFAVQGPRLQFIARCVCHRCCHVSDCALVHCSAWTVKTPTMRLLTCCPPTTQTTGWGWCAYVGGCAQPILRRCLTTGTRAAS